MKDVKQNYDTSNKNIEAMIIKSDNDADMAEQRWRLKRLFEILLEADLKVLNDLMAHEADGQNQTVKRKDKLNG